MDPIAGTDVKRKKRRGIPEPDSGGDFLDRLKRMYTFRIQHVENILPTISEKMLCEIFFCIKKLYEQKVKSIDSILELKIINIELLKDYVWRKDIYPYFDMENCLRRNFPNYRNNRYRRSIFRSFLKMPLEELLPSITEQWLKDIINKFRENLLKKRELKE